MALAGINQGMELSDLILFSHFTSFLLLQTSQNVQAYTVLCEKYKQFIDRDPQYLEYLDKIGQNYFGIPPPRKARPGGMFSGNKTYSICLRIINNICPLSGLFDSLLNAMNDDSSDDENGPPPGPSSASAARNTSTGASASGVKKKLEQEDLD